MQTLQLFRNTIGALTFQKVLNIYSRKKMQSTSRRQTPSEFLKKIVGKPVVVKLNSGVDYRGKCLNIL